MIIGLLILIFFAYKAIHEVSNPKIAAGTQEHTQAVQLSTQPLSIIGAPSPGYSLPAVAAHIAANPPQAPESDSPAVTDVAAAQQNHKIPLTADDELSPAHKVRNIPTQVTSNLHTKNPPNYE